MSQPRSPIIHPRRRPAATALLAAAALFAAGLFGVSLAGCGGDGGGDGGSGSAVRDLPADGAFAGAPVVLISIDTLRSDRLPAYGYDGVETPAIDALRADGVLFERAYSHYPLTLPSHVSLLTGQLPSRHGVRDNVGYDFDAAAHPFLPRQLKEAGYATGGAISAFVLRGGTGLSASFDLYQDAVESGLALSLGEVQRSGSETLAAAGDWLQGAAGSPFFFFFHIYEPHTPYTPPEPYASRYRDRYDGEIAAADAVIGELVAELKRLGVYDEALIVLLSDHGESLGEHGEREHGILLYRAALQVPLIVKLPGGRLAGAATAEPAQLVDVAPTVLAALGLERPAEIDGAPLLELLGPDPAPRQIYAESYYPRLHYGWSELTALIEDELQLIQGPDPELYDLLADPDQQANLLADRRRDFARLRDALQPFQTALAAPGQVDQATAERLAALGYVSSGPVATGDGPLPDPKSKIHLLEELNQARTLLIEGRFAEAQAIVEPLLADNPEMSDALGALSQAQAGQGQLALAAETLRRAIEKTGPQPDMLNRLSNLYLRMGRLTEAEEHARLIVESRPAVAHIQLSRVALARGDLEEAEEQARLGADQRGSLLAPLVHLGTVLSRREKVEEAGALLDELEEQLARRTSQEELPGVHFLRGDVAARQGRLDEARRQFEAEIALDDSSLDAYARLAFLQALEGDGQRAVLTIREMVEKNESPAAYAAAVTTLQALGDPRGAASLLAFARQRYPGSEQLEAL